VQWKLHHETPSDEEWSKATLQYIFVTEGDVGLNFWLHIPKGTQGGYVAIDNIQSQHSTEECQFEPQQAKPPEGILDFTLWVNQIQIKFISILIRTQLQI